MANEKRLIDANERMKWVEDNTTEEAWLVNQYNADWIYSMLESAPTVDAVEVVHGRWEFGELEIMGQPVHCSICGWGADMVNKAMWLEYPGHKYCGNCGAKMDGGNEHG